METDILDSLNDIGYEGPLSDEAAFTAALAAGPKSLELTKLVHILAAELKELLSLEETVSMMNSPDESNTFLMELSSFLKELGCPYTKLVTGHMSSRLQCTEDCVLLLEYLVSELMAARMVRHDRPQTGPNMEIVVQESPTARDLKNILISLKFNKPPPGITAEVLFAKLETKLKDTIQKEGDNLVGKPLYNKALTEKQWRELETAFAEMSKEYKLRRETLITRLECTIRSFEWSDRLKCKKDAILSVSRPAISSLSPRPGVTLSQLLAARSSMLEEKRKKDAESHVRGIVIGPVPDRGGRPSEAQPPPPEMPSWQQRTPGQEEDGAVSSGDIKPERTIHQYERPAERRQRRRNKKLTYTLHKKILLEMASNAAATSCKLEENDLTQDTDTDFTDFDSNTSWTDDQSDDKKEILDVTDKYLEPPEPMQNGSNNIQVHCKKRRNTESNASTTQHENINRGPARKRKRNNRSVPIAIATSLKRFAVAIYREDGVNVDENTGAVIKKRLVNLLTEAIKAKVDSKCLKFAASGVFFGGFYIVTPMTPEAQDWLLKSDFGYYNNARLVSKTIVNHPKKRITVWLPGDNNHDDPLLLLKGQNSERGDLRIDEWATISKIVKTSGVELIVIAPLDVLRYWKTPIWLNYETTMVEAKMIVTYDNNYDKMPEVVDSNEGSNDVKVLNVTRATQTELTMVDIDNMAL
ncbi:unnamed protein product [Plutella xylostella]|uniref:(diamondback moth) hypothetical protein n=1 Tax=Plutella xylostella TaxID=51655 RepID=A0A8S4GB83_PLUXY|nr:unnamed protein product [Plutella xylostella]